MKTETEPLLDRIAVSLDKALGYINAFWMTFLGLLGVALYILGSQVEADAVGQDLRVFFLSHAYKIFGLMLLALSLIFAKGVWTRILDWIVKKTTRS